MILLALFSIHSISKAATIRGSVMEIHYGAGRAAAANQITTKTTRAKRIADVDPVVIRGVHYNLVDGRAQKRVAITGRGSCPSDPGLERTVEYRRRIRTGDAIEADPEERVQR